MRYAFAKSLFRIAQKDQRIILLTGDLGYTVFEEFERFLPKQFINMGVAEANMIGVAAGLALSGFIPFVYSIATFATMRGYEQLRNDVCLHNANVKIVGSGAGLSYGHAGSTHHALEDIAITRILPGMCVLCPCDGYEVEALLPQIVKRNGPVYLRLGKAGEPPVYSTCPGVKIGRANKIMKGTDVCCIATGNLVYNAQKAAGILRKRNISVEVIDMFTVKPLDLQLLKNLSRRFFHIITVEEHFTYGGLGGAVAEVLSQTKGKAQLTCIGTGDKFVEEVGNQQFLREQLNLTPKLLAKTIENLLK